MKQTLVEKGIYREQENSHFEWPDHTTVLPKRTGVSFGHWMIPVVLWAI